MEITYVGAIAGIFIIIFATTFFAYFEGSSEFYIAINAILLLAILTVILNTAALSFFLGFKSEQGRNWGITLAGFILFFASEAIAISYGRCLASESVAVVAGVVLLTGFYLTFRLHAAMGDKKEIYSSLLVFAIISALMAAATYPVLQSDLPPFEKAHLFSIPFVDLAAIALLVNTAIALRGSSSEKALIFFVQGLLSILTADLIMGQIRMGDEKAGGTVNLLYVIGWVLLAIGIYVYRVAPLEGMKKIVVRRE